MAGYVFHLMVGYLPTGVDYAQAERMLALRQLSEPVKCVFVDGCDYYYFQRYVDMGIRPEELLDAHFYMAGQGDMAGLTHWSTLATRIMRELSADNIVRKEGEIQLYSGEVHVATIFLRNDGENAYGVNYYRNGYLMATEFYTHRLMYTSYYVTAEDRPGHLYAKLARTEYKDEDGFTAFDVIHMGERDDDIYCFPDGWTGNRADFLERFVRALELTEKDFVIIDRPTQLVFSQPLLRWGSKAKLYVFLHSLHEVKKYEDGLVSKVNYEYYDWFRNSDKLEAFVVSTEAQRLEVIDFLESHGLAVPKVVVIPAGMISAMEYPENDRKPFSLISVSRLHRRKGIAAMIKAVAKARESLPELTFDLYGKGNVNYMAILNSLLEELGATDYIRFMGHQDIDGVYAGYEAFITASTWETLGLSMMEAVAAGDAMIGLDSRYGASLFIEDGVNGRLIPYDGDTMDLEDEATEAAIADALAAAIVDTFSDRERLQQWSEASYAKAEAFTRERVGAKWIELLS